MECEPTKEELTATEAENLEKILNKLLSVKKYKISYNYYSIKFFY